MTARLGVVMTRNDRRPIGRPADGRAPHARAAVRVRLGLLAALGGAPALAPAAAPSARPLVAPASAEQPALQRHDAAGHRWRARADGTLDRLAPDGRLAWRQALPPALAPAGLQLNDLQLDAAGTATLLATVGRPEPWRAARVPGSAAPAAATDILVWRLDATGRLLWHTRYREGDEGTQRAWSLALADDGSAWVAATMAMDRSGRLPELPLLLQVDAAGRAGVLGVGPLFGGCAVAVAGRQVTVAGPGRISRFEPDGRLLWSTRLPSGTAVDTLALGPAGQVTASGRHGQLRLSAAGVIEAPAGRRPGALQAPAPPPARLAAQRRAGSVPTTPCTSQSMPAI